MAKNPVISRSEFKRLLNWLDKNQDNAAQKYEKIRQKLIRIFHGRGCFEAEELADETFDRVTAKLSAIVENYTGEPTLYFYGVANNVYREWFRRQSLTKPLEFEDRISAAENAEPDIEFECLENCLEKLSENQIGIVIEYYKDTKQAKIETRKNLALTLGITASALQIRVHRLRGNLRECIDGCVAEKKM